MNTYIRFLILFVTAFCFLTLSDIRKSEACKGTSTSVCTISRTACLKSMVLSKSVPFVVLKPPAVSVSFNVQSSLFITCPTQTNCGTACPGGGTSPVGGSLGVSLFSTPPGPSPVATGNINTYAGTMTMPTCSAGGVFNPYLVPVTVPAATPVGCYTVVGKAVVPFSDGTTLTQTGDTVVCLVEPAPGQPSLPRLNVELLSGSAPRMAPGDQHTATYRVTNNDPTFPVTLTAFGNSKQNAVRPLGGNEYQGVFSISSPFGDDFPIFFNPGGCIPLPAYPYTQPEISQPLPPLGPGMNTTINVGIRSYGQCASGSCSESTFRVEGTFGDGSTAKACAGMALFADTSMPTTGCGTGENDCNHNGIPDAVDIFTNPSLDTNFNAMPDTCETGLLRLQPQPLPKNAYVPIELVQLSLVSIGPAQVTNVWANGVPMTSPSGINWVGQIPAASTVGPHTISFVGKDVQGRLATNILTYRVVGNSPGDFDGDNKADLAIVRRTGGAMIWYILKSTGGVIIQQHGLDTDIPVPGDYDGDRQANIGVWRPGSGTFYPDTNPATNYGYFPFGTMGDKPLIGDYDGDGRTDFAVFRPSDHTFYTYDSLAGRVRQTPFGFGTDKPVTGDYDGDGRTDIAVWRDTEGIFYWFNSVNNTFSAAQWGQSGDQPISGDFDGDGRADLCIFRAGVWWIRFSSNGSTRATSWGLAADVPVPADYDGDGKIDLAVYRNGIWHILRSSDGAYLGPQWGISTDTPVPSTYQPY